MRHQKSALERALPIVAAAYGEQFGVNVRLSGSDAYTDGKTIVLPMFDAMSELKEVLFGYLAHEAAHVRDSDFSVVAHCKNPVEKLFLNIIEDFRIEKLMEDCFPGTRHTLEAMWNHICEEGMTHASRPEANEANQLAMYLLHYVQAEGLGREASDPLLEASRKVIEQTFPPGFFVRFDVLMAKKLQGAASTNDCLKLARAVLKALKEAEEERQQQEQQQNPDQSSQSDGQDQNADDSSQGASQPEQDPSSGDGSDQDSGSDGSQSKQDTDGADGSAGGTGGDSAGADGSTDGSGGDANDSSSSTDSDSSQSNQESSSAPGGSDDQAGSGNKPSMHDRVLNETDLVDDALEALKEEFKSTAEEDNGEGGNFSFSASNVGKPVGNEGDSDSLNEGILSSSAIRARLLGLLQAQTRQRQRCHYRWQLPLFLSVTSQCRCFRGKGGQSVR